MGSRRRWLGRGLAAAIFAVPLLASGPCVQIGQNATITGFFNALTSILVQRLQDQLGVTDSTAQTAATGSSDQNTSP